jgi:hypothetical protein
MRYSVFAAVSLFLAVASAAPAALVARDNDDGQPRICPSLRVKGGGCVRCNFSITPSPLTF